MLKDRQEWLEWRKQGIGSSDAPAVMGVSRFKTRLQLWEEKTSTRINEDESNAFIKDAGNQAEVKIRSFFELIQGEKFDVALCEMQAFPFMRVSLDGRNEEATRIIEIKLLGNSDGKFDRAQNEKIVPEEYYPQIQMQLLVSGAEMCYFVAYKYNHEDRFMNNPMTHEGLAVIEVFPDKEYQTDLLSKCIEFWNLVQTKKPPEIEDRDWKTLKNAAKAAKKFKIAKAKAEKFEAEADEAREELIALATASGHPRCQCAGIKMQQVSKAGSVNYKNIPELSGVDLDKYRSKGSIYWKLS